MAMATDWQSGKTLLQSLTYMFEKEIDTDVTFRFPNSDETVEAHRLVLKARSRVFFTMFHSGSDKPRKDVEVPDIEPDIFKDFLRYLYSDDTKLTTTKALQLTYCAEKFDVKALKVRCIEYLLQSVNEMTWAEILDHAVFFKETSLTQACLHFFTSSKSLEMEGLDDYHITKETLEVILDYEQHSVREVDIFRFCDTWSEQECEEKEIPTNMANKRKMLGPLLRKIPFCSMKQAEFVAEVSGQNLLNGHEELQILRFLCAADKSNPPFPCMKRGEARDLPVPIELPDVWDSIKGGVYSFSIKCTQSFTLIGLTFTEPGTFLISFGSIIEHLEVHQDCLTVSLKEAVVYEAGTMLNIQDASAECLHKAKTDYTFSHYVHSNDSDLYKKLDFILSKNNDVGNPPFDTLIVKL